MKTIVSLAIIIFLCYQTSGQDLIPYRNGERWGFANPSGKVVIQPVYDRTWFFTGDGVARVQLNGLFGFIDKTGAVKIKPEFSEAGDFVMGVALVKRKAETLCINLDGQPDECTAPDEDEYIDPEPVEQFFTKISSRNKYRLVVSTTGDTLQPEFDRIDFVSRYFFPRTNHFAIVYKNGLKGAYNQMGIPVVPVKYRTMDILDMESYKAKENNKWGVLKFDGTTVLPFEYDSVKKVTELLFKEDRLNKNDHFIVSKGGRFGVVDHSNKTILKPIYDKITIPICSCPTEYVATQNGLTGTFDHTGKMAIPLRYQNIQPFKGAAYTMVVTSTGKEGYINRKGFEFFAE
jgi:hypothetical protein